VQTVVVRVLTAVFALVVLVIPVFAPSLKKARSGGATRLNGWGIGFLISALLMLFGSFYEIQQSHQQAIKATEDVKAILSKIEQESYRLTDSDFKLRVISAVSVKDTSCPVPDLRPMHIRGHLDSAFFIFELEEIRDPVTDAIFAGLDGRAYGMMMDLRFRGGTGPTRVKIPYYAHNMTFGGLEEYPYLQSLDGKCFHFSLPMKRLEFRDGSWEHHVDLYVKGRHFAGEADDKGRVTIPISLGQTDSSSLR